MSYQSLLDYLGDQRAPEHLWTPPGGSTGDRVADSMLCVVAERGRCNPDPIGYLRGIAAHFASQPTVTPSIETVIARIAVWCDERRAA